MSGTASGGASSSRTPAPRRRLRCEITLGPVSMIVPTSDLTRLRGKVAMVDGGFDPIHDGHIDYFREASELGPPVLCNVSSDEWVETKHPPLLGHAERARVIDAIRYIDYVHISRMP